MEWYREIQFVAAVPMPPDLADRFGTTINGMWASPEASSASEVAARHRAGQRVLFSVPMIALVPRVYEAPATAHLLDEVCLDIGGRPAECAWYYWERKPVYAACIYSDIFRGYLMRLCTQGIDRGTDVVNLDEIMTSVGLLNRDPRGTGFCARCLERFRQRLRRDGGADLATADDDALRDRLWRDDELFETYRRFQEREAFDVMLGYVAELRAYADDANRGFAISANVAYLGNMVRTFGPLWGCLWGPHVAFVLMENDYRVRPGDPHELLPRGTFTPWYRLGAAFHGVPTWICPSINVPRQLAGQDRRRYYELMFLEAYANNGRWGYYWWPGVDVETRLRETAPERLIEHIHFVAAHRELYETAETANGLAIVYLDGPIMRRPETHQRYVALAQALAELGYQFDVRYVGDGVFNPDDLDAAQLGRYRAVLLPEARDLGPVPTAALEAYARAGGDLIGFSDGPIAPELVRWEDGTTLDAFWTSYRDEDRERIGATVAGHGSSRILLSDPSVRATRFAAGGRQVVHVLNYAYDPATDEVAPARDVRVDVPWTGGSASVARIGIDAEEPVPCTVEAGRLVFELPRLDLYALTVIRPGP